MLSVCETVDLAQLKTSKGIQGNLLNTMLYAPEKVFLAEVKRLLTAAKKHHRKYVFNLNHGVLPDTDPLKLKAVVEAVHAFKWK